MASKEHERIFLDGWLESQPHLSFVEDSERPDFILSDAEGEIGVEVRQVFRDNGRKGSPAYTEEVLRGKFLGRVARAYYRAGGKPISVSSLMRTVPADEGAVDRIVARLLQERPSTIGEQRRLANVEGAVIYVRAVPETFTEYSIWSCVENSTGRVGVLASELIEEAVREKADKLKAYQERVERVILLLGVYAMHESGMFRIDEAYSLPEAYGFDSVHIYLHPLGSVRLA